MMESKMTDAWNGIPERADVSGPHWAISRKNTVASVYHWNAREQTFGGHYFEDAAPRYRYIGVCLAPDEVLARERTAFLRGLEAAARLAEATADQTNKDCFDILARDIRQLPTPEFEP